MSTGLCDLWLSSLKHTGGKNRNFSYKEDACLNFVGKQIFLKFLNAQVSRCKFTLFKKKHVTPKHVSLKYKITIITNNFEL